MFALTTMLSLNREQVEATAEVEAAAVTEVEAAMLELERDPDAGLKVEAAVAAMEVETGTGATGGAAEEGRSCRKRSSSRGGSQISGTDAIQVNQTCIIPELNLNERKTSVM